LLLLIFVSFLSIFFKLYNETNANIDLSQLEKENVNNKDLDYAFVCKEIRDLIKRLKKNNQPGIDLIKLYINSFPKRFWIISM
jgi:dynactin complex subunit